MSFLENDRRRFARPAFSPARHKVNPDRCQAMIHTVISCSCELEQGREFVVALGVLPVRSLHCLPCSGANCSLRSSRVSKKTDSNLQSELQCFPTAILLLPKKNLKGLSVASI